MLRRRHVRSRTQADQCHVVLEPVVRAAEQPVITRGRDPGTAVVLVVRPLGDEPETGYPDGHRVCPAWGTTERANPGAPRGSPPPAGRIVAPGAAWSWPAVVGASTISSGAV